MRQDKSLHDVAKSIISGDRLRAESDLNAVVIEQRHLDEMWEVQGLGMPGLSDPNIDVNAAVCATLRLMLEDQETLATLRDLTELLLSMRSEVRQ